MTLITSQEIKKKLTHVTNVKNIPKILEDGFKKGSDGNENNDYYFKPNGVWISVNNGWENWCKAESFDDITAERILPVVIKDNLKILQIDNFDDFMEYYKKFYTIETYEKLKNKVPDNRAYELEIYNPETSMRSSWTIAHFFWKWLEEVGFDGIYLTEKGQWATRMKTFMYGWDCASIVIFDPSNISIAKLKK